MPDDAKLVEKVVKGNPEDAIVLYRDAKLLRELWPLLPVVAIVAPFTVPFMAAPCVSHLGSEGDGQGRREGGHIRYIETNIRPK